MLLIKFHTYVSTETHEADMLQHWNRHELTQQHQRNTKSRKIQFSFFSKTSVLYSVSFINYHECGGYFNSSCKDKMFD